MSTNQGDAERGTGRAEVVKQPPHVGLFPLLRQERRRQQPARRRAQAREVVGVDVDGVPADAVGGERDRVAFGNEQPPITGRTKHVYHRGVGPNPWADDDTRIVLRQVCQERGQEIRRELAETHRHRSSRLPRPCRGLRHPCSETCRCDVRDRPGIVGVPCLGPWHGLASIFV